MRIKDFNKERRISEATIKLINLHGFESTSISKIANEAGLSPATIYLYFRNKEELLNEVYLKAEKRFSEKILKDFDLSLPIKEGFELFLMNTLISIIQEPDDFQFIEQFGNSPLINKITKKEEASYYSEITKLIQQGKTEGIILDLDDEVILAFGLAPILQLAKKHLNGNLQLNQKIIKQVLTAAWRAIKR